jgi:hypothetical protein
MRNLSARQRSVKGTVARGRDPELREATRHSGEDLDAFNVVTTRIALSDVSSHKANIDYSGRVVAGRCPTRTAPKRP